LRRIGGATGLYIRFLGGALQHPGKVLLAAAATLIGVQWYYANHGNGIEFFPDVEPQLAQLHVHARGNLSVWEQDALVGEVEDRILDIRGIKAVYARTLGRGQEGGADVAEDVIGTILLEFLPWDQRRQADAILAEVLTRTAGLAGITVEPRKAEAGPPIGKPIQLELRSREPALLGPAVARTRALLDTVPGLKDIEDSRPLPGIEWELVVDRAQAAKFGADVMSVGDVIQVVTKGLKLGEYRPDDARDEIDIVARLPERHRTIDELDQIRLETTNGMVPIGNFVTRRAQPKTGTVTRVDGHRVMTLKADVEPGVLVDDMVRRLRAGLAAAELDPAVEIAFRGEDEEQKEAQGFLVKAFAVALFLMAIILVTQFNSFYSALLILSAVVMSTVGVIVGLIVTGQPFGIVMSGIGVIALAGIVVNNNIVLIDTYDRLAKTVDDPLQAILRTGAQRLRPVLLTTVTTILGLMPMVLATNIDFATRQVSTGAPSTQWWTQLSSAIVFGLGFATVLTLVVTPSALMLRANLRAKRAGWRAGRGAPESPADRLPQAAD
jgi:multidrug efflux pump